MFSVSNTHRVTNIIESTKHHFSVTKFTNHKIDKNINTLKFTRASSCFRQISFVYHFMTTQRKNPSKKAFCSIDFPSTISLNNVG